MSTDQLEKQMQFRGVLIQRAALIIAGLVFLLSLSATAQEKKSEISLQGTGSFTRDVHDQNTFQQSTNSGGFLVGYRYHFNRWLAADGNYGWNRNTQEYFGPAGFTAIRSNVHEVSGDMALTLTIKVARLRPYALAGVGALIFDPRDGIGEPGFADTQTKPAFIYGVGVDYDLVHNVALRVGYRGLVYKAPDFGVSALDVDKVTHTAQPSAGIVFRF
jgi:opacity protein-like surface antigen